MMDDSSKGMPNITDRINFVTYCLESCDQLF